MTRGDGGGTDGSDASEAGVAEVRNRSVATLEHRRLGKQPLLQIAPMMEVTYKDFRQFMRLLTAHAQLWTEMVVDNTLIHAERVDGFLAFSPNEHPIVCQLGGSQPECLARAAKLAEQWGYDEVNLNCGCPSDRISGKGEFGASLMKRPHHVRDCLIAMKNAVNIPVTVKCRLGVDDDDSPEFTAGFISAVAEAGVKHVIVHARKCLLNGLTPDENRRIPPLLYDRVFRLCREFPDMCFTLNGGVVSLAQTHSLLAEAPPNLIGIMIGRASYGNPCCLADVDRCLYGERANPGTAASRYALLRAYCEYLEETYPPEVAAAASSTSGHVQYALKPILAVFNGVPGNKILRQGIDRLAHDREFRKQGPGAVLRRLIELLAADVGARASLHAPLVTPATPLEVSCAQTPPQAAAA